MVNKDKPRIIQEYNKIKGVVSKFVIKDVVKALGGSGYVSVPKELIGQYVTISYDKSKEGSEPQ